MPRTDRDRSGDRLGQFELVAKIGAGGMGVVYRAFDTVLGRDVAIKVLASERMGSKTRRRRFVQEARSAAAVNHPNITTIYEIGETDDVVFIAMELVRGEPLSAVLRDRRPKIDSAISIAVQIAGALARAHDAGVIHRDLKPSNIMVNKHGEAKLCDFGIAKLLERERPVALLGPTQPQTGEGVLLGTPGYMAPEQILGKDVDHRADIFAFGCTLYALISRQHPFARETPSEMNVAIARDEPRPLAQLRPEVPRDLVAIIDRCLAKDPGARYQNAGDLAAELEAVARRVEPPRPEPAHSLDEVPTVPAQRATPPPSTSSRPSWAVMGIAVVAVAAIVTVALLSSGGDRGPLFERPRALELVEHRVTRETAENLITAAASMPDGAHVAVASPRGLTLRPINRGPARRLPSPSTVITGLAAFPGGERLLVIGRADDGRPTIWEQRLDGPSRMLARGSQACLSKDGARIAYASESGLFARAVDGADEPVLLAALVRSDRICACSWTPDGTAVALIHERKSNAGRARSLELHARDGTSSTKLVEDQRLMVSGVCALAWSSDRRLLFARARSQAGMDLIELDSHDRTSRVLESWPQSLISDLQIRGGRGTYLRWEQHQTDVTIRDASDDWSAPAVRLTDHDGNDVPIGWTADDRVVFSSDRNGTWDLFVQSPDGGEAELILGSDLDEGWGFVRGDEVWTYRIDPGASSCQLVRAPIDGSSEPRVVLDGLGVRHEGSEVHPDNCSTEVTCASARPDRCVAVDFDGGRVTFAPFDPETGNVGVPIHERPRPGVTGLPSISPDGTSIAWAVRGERPVAAVLEVPGGVVREVPLSLRGKMFLLWWADSSSWYAIGSLSDGGVYAVARASMDGQARVLWTSTSTTILRPLPSPDGRRLALVTDSADNDVFVLDGLPNTDD